MTPDPTGMAERICQFMQRRLVLWEGPKAGERLQLTQWQREIVYGIYGPVDEDGQRQVRTACLWLPRGSAKTALGSALALAHYVGPQRVDAGQVYLVASDRETAGLAYGHVRYYCEGNPAIEKLIQPVHSRKHMYKPRDRSWLRVLATDGGRAQGKAATFLLADELHVWYPRGRAMYDAITKSMAKRMEHIPPLTVVLSTAGEGEGTLAWDMWQRSLAKLRDPESDPTFYAAVWGAPEDADWRDEDVWMQHHPGLSAGMVSLKALRDERTAAEKSPAKVSYFRRYYLNQWQHGSDADPWIEMQDYDASAHPRRGLDELAGEECWVGIDLGHTQDLTAVVAVFRTPVPAGDGYVLDVYARMFAPGRWLERRGDRDRAGYLQAIETGEFRRDGDRAMDYATVVAYITRLTERYDVRRVAIDPYRAEFVEADLAALDVEVVQHRQGMASMARPTLVTRNLIAAGRFRHGGNRLLRGNFANAVADIDAAGNERLSKSKSAPRGRIDGAVAAVMACGMATEDLVQQTPAEIMAAMRQHIAARQIQQPPPEEVPAP